ncbi:MAG: hypothetical protein IJ336_03685 [Lachnospiraceae bacterium]|nr:hypothetical protein [Lachnospiraceae bacterium]MBQ7832662.1 hypothetical protein [Lachnospiraceae bacterium]
MELMFPVAIFIGVPLAIVLTFITIKRKDTFRKGKKVANTNFMEETPLYKRLIIEYRVFSILALTCLWISLILAIVMLARPVKIDVVTTEMRNRDIFICMDISDSVDELNLQICGELKEVVKGLDGERFGITIFNGKSVLLVPLTTDYEYILDTLDRLEDAFEYSLGTGDYELWEDQNLYEFKYEGTLWEDGRGSSFIGDGLASCLYNFPDLKENSERSRLIIFTTDNELNEITGTSLVTVEEAAKLCVQNDVKVFAVTPRGIIDEVSFKTAMESTGGGFYEVTSNNSNKIFEKLTDDIKLTETSVIQDVETIITDKPEVLFVFLLVCMSMYFIFSRKVKL